MKPWANVAELVLDTQEDHKKRIEILEKGFNDMRLDQARLTVKSSVYSTVAHSVATIIAVLIVWYLKQ